MSKTLSKAALICYKAANLIERDGWCQNQARSGSGRRCISAALLDAQDIDYAVYDSVAFRLHTQAVQTLGFNGMEIVRWNDQPERTEEEVLQRLRSVR